MNIESRASWLPRSAGVVLALLPACAGAGDSEEATPVEAYVEAERKAESDAPKPYVPIADRTANAGFAGHGEDAS